MLSLRAEVDGQVAGMWIGGHYGGTMIALNTVSDRAFIKYSVNNLMNWHAIQWSCRQGLEAHDLGGSRIRSLEAFKASFGARECIYSNIKKVHSPMASAAVWVAGATVGKLRARWFRRSQKGAVQKRLRPGYRPAGKPDDPPPGQSRRKRRQRARSSPPDASE